MFFAKRKQKKLEKKVKRFVSKYSTEQIIKTFRDVLDSKESRAQKEYETAYNAFILFLNKQEEREKNQQNLTKKEIRQGNSLAKKVERIEQKWNDLIELKSIFLSYDKEFRDVE